MDDHVLPDDFHLDILKGLAVYFDSGFVADIQKTATRFPGPNLGSGDPRGPGHGNADLAAPRRPWIRLRPYVPA